MIIRLYPENNALPIGPAVNRVGSALPLRIVGAPSGATAVAVSVFNADGATCNLDATLRGGEWVATVPASHFASWGKVARGLQVAVSYKDETDTTQTVVFVGDVRIEKTVAGDPEGTGKRSVPVTEVDEVADGSSMKDVRDKVNEIAKIISGTATALVLMALPLSAATPLEDIPGTNEVYTAAETDARIIELAPTPGNYATVSNRAMHAVQTETDPSVPAWAKAQTPPASMTTNAVCDIVTNEVATSWIYGDWVWTGAPDENPGPPVYHASTGLWTIPDIGDFYADIGKSVSAPANATSITWTIYFKSGEVCIMVGDASSEYCELWMDEVNVYSGPTTNAFFHAGDYYQAESATVEQIEYGSGNFFTFYKFSPYPVTASRTATASSTRNALGLAREKDLPNKMPVDEILLNGADGKVYHLRIGAGGSVDIYTEVNQ